MYQQDWMKQVSGAMGPQQGQSPTPKPQIQTPQKTKFTIDDLKEIMGVLMGPSSAGSASQAFEKVYEKPVQVTSMYPQVSPNYPTSLRPGFPDVGDYGGSPIPESAYKELAMAMNAQRIPYPKPASARLLPTQQAVVPIGIYE